MTTNIYDLYNLHTRSDSDSDNDEFDLSVYMKGAGGSDKAGSDKAGSDSGRGRGGPGRGGPGRGGPGRGSSESESQGRGRGGPDRGRGRGGPGRGASSIVSKLVPDYGIAELPVPVPVYQDFCCYCQVDDLDIMGVTDADRALIGAPYTDIDIGLHKFSNYKHYPNCVQNRIDTKGKEKDCPVIIFKNKYLAKFAKLDLPN